MEKLGLFLSVLVFSHSVFAGPCSEIYEQHFSASVSDTHLSIFEKDKLQDEVQKECEEYLESPFNPFGSDMKCVDTGCEVSGTFPQTTCSYEAVCKSFP